MHDKYVHDEFKFCIVKHSDMKGNQLIAFSIDIYFKELLMVKQINLNLKYSTFEV